MTQQKPVPTTRKTVTLPDTDWKTIAICQVNYGFTTEAETVRFVIRNGLNALQSNLSRN